MVVCIAEKPSVAKDIARIIGATQQKNGYMEGNGYQVTWTFGHLCELKMPEDYTAQWKRWELSSLPMIPPRFGIKLKDDDGIKRQYATIEHLMKQADTIINCGDAGQEGELIQRWVMQKANPTCPIKRLWISSMTDEAIREGFAQLKEQSNYDSLYMAGLSRAIGDWLLGINATRLYSIKYGHPGHPLSIGRVQTPTLAMIVQRQKEINNFRPEQYWVLSTIYRDTTFTAVKGKFASKEEGEEAFKTIEGKPFEIVDIQQKNGKEAPPHLYDLTSLQVDCNRKFGLSAETTLNVIQGLYERKLTTYPRVDTQYLSDDIYDKCPNTLRGLKGYEQFTNQLLTKKLLKSKKVFDSSKVTDHHAIIPTGVPANYLTDIERNVYDLIARRFIEVFYPDCVFSTTTVMGRIENVEMKASGKQIIKEGWRVVEKKDTTNESETQAKEETETNAIMPNFVKGESGQHKPTLTEKWTSPPKFFTEATLLRAMETAGKMVEDEKLRAAMKENGIGRPSTRAAIIETLFKRRYIKKERKSILATATGIELIELIHDELLKSPELTGIWEKKLRDIEAKKYDPATFINELKEQITQIVRRVMQESTTYRVHLTTEEDLKQKINKKKSNSNNAENDSKKAAIKQETSPEGKVCPLCGQGTIIKGRTAFGCSRWREGCNYRLPFSNK